MNFISKALVCAILLGIPCWAQEQLTIAAAADLQPVMREIAGRFERKTKTQVKLSFGSSGTFYAQIHNGAPYDLFFSADVEYPKRLEHDGFTEPGSTFCYATGQIAVWVPTQSDIDLSKGLAALVDSSVKKLAIANPAHAPYGRAAEAALKASGVWDKVSSKLVLGENISQAAEFVQSGNADAGILALSLVLAPGMKSQGRYFEVPRNLYPPLQQSAVVMKHAIHKAAAQRFLEYMKSAEIQSFLQQSGFITEQSAR